LGWVHLAAHARRSTTMATSRSEGSADELFAPHTVGKSKSLDQERPALEEEREGELRSLRLETERLIRQAAEHEVDMEMQAEKHAQELASMTTTPVDTDNEERDGNQRLVVPALGTAAIGTAATAAAGYAAVFAAIVLM